MYVCTYVRMYVLGRYVCMCVPIIFGRLPSVLGSPVIVSGDLPIVLNCFFWQPSNWIVFSSIVSRFWPWASQVPFQHLYKSILGIDRMSPGLRLVRSIPWILYTDVTYGRTTAFPSSPLGSLQFAHSSEPLPHFGFYRRMWWKAWRSSSDLGPEVQSCFGWTRF